MGSKLSDIHLQVGWGCWYNCDMPPGGDQDKTTDCYGAKCDENFASWISIRAEHYVQCYRYASHIHYHNYYTNDVS